MTLLKALPPFSDAKTRKSALARGFTLTRQRTEGTKTGSMLFLLQMLYSISSHERFLKHTEFM